VSALYHLKSHRGEEPGPGMVREGMVLNQITTWFSKTKIMKHI
jgi:hypothetical protein